ncbi:TPA: hypothetical protein LLS51_004501 [Serratia marcescens]|uniref:hypothetical protein n=1 Tax=Serratia marcescens TaxID=615 RepID=UPI0013DBB235|nr:hypothetical protein [Serratia marcescens]HBK4675072.1 hypothetical protein [Serratia marcescens]
MTFPCYFTGLTGLMGPSLGANGSKIRRCTAEDLAKPFDNVNIFALLCAAKKGITFANK